MTFRDDPFRLLRRISIHIPRVGDDDRAGAEQWVALRISIHIPRVGDDVCYTCKL